MLSTSDISCNNLNFQGLDNYSPISFFQATPENIKMLKEGVNTLKPDDKADFKQAFEFAFNLLNKVGMQCDVVFCGFSA